MNKLQRQLLNEDSSQVQILRNVTQYDTCTCKKCIIPFRILLSPKYLLNPMYYPKCIYLFVLIYLLLIAG